MKRVKVQPCPACGSKKSIVEKLWRRCINLDGCFARFADKDWSRLSLAVQVADERYRLYLESDNPIFEFQTKQEIAYAKFKTAEVERQKGKK